MTGPRPLPDDPTRAQVAAMLDVLDAEWLLLADGDFSSAAVETMKADGTGHQIAIALELPCRVNNTTDLRTVRLLIGPEDAAGLAETLTHTATWLLARAMQEQLLDACLDVLTDDEVLTRHPRGLTFAGDVWNEVVAKYGAEAFPGATFLTVADVLARHDRERGQ